MKRPILILISVLLLALTLIYRGNQAPKLAESAKPVPIRDPNRGGSKAQLKPEPEIPHFSWREVESADYRQYPRVAKLPAAVNIRTKLIHRHLKLTKSI